MKRKYSLHQRPSTAAGMVFDIRRYSIHDGPGIRTTVFFKGCPLACSWCHNPEGLSFTPELINRRSRCIHCYDCTAVCPNEAISRLEDDVSINRSSCKVMGNCAAACPAEALQVVGEEMDAGRVMDDIERDLPFFRQSQGGATFSGGEPLSQPEFLLELLSACRQKKIHTTVDTSGHAAWKVLNEVRLLTDMFLYDVKLMDESRHHAVTGVSNRDILFNLRQLATLGNNILVRIPVIPGINDDDDNLRAIGEFLSRLPRTPPVELLAFHNIAEQKYASLGKEYLLRGLCPPEKEHLMKCAGILRDYGILEISI